MVLYFQNLLFKGSLQELMLIFEEEAAETYCDKRVPGCNTPILNVKGLEPTLIPPHIKDKVYFLFIFLIKTV